MILVLYILVLAAWAAVVAYMVPAVWAIYRQTARYGDSSRLVCFAWGLLNLGFLSRRIIMDRDGDPAIVALLIASFCVAVLTIGTARRYGRGYRV